MLQSRSGHGHAQKLSPLQLMAKRLSARFRYRLNGWRAPVKKPLIDSISSNDDAFRHLSFTFALVAVSARVACADGNLTREKYIAFRESFPLKSSLCSRVRQLFSLACNDHTPLEHYLNQIKTSYPERIDLFAAVVDHLFRIAIAGGHISRQSEILLASISRSFSLAPTAYSQLLARYVQSSQAKRVLGVGSRTKASILKKRYHELMRSYHPDRFGGDALSPELESLLNIKASEINAAYRALSKKAA